jgi:hypothetical protein
MKSRRDDYYYDILKLGVIRLSKAWGCGRKGSESIIVQRISYVRHSIIQEVPWIYHRALQLIIQRIRRALGRDRLDSAHLLNASVSGAYENAAMSDFYYTYKETLNGLARAQLTWLASYVSQRQKRHTRIRIPGNTTSMRNGSLGFPNDRHDPLSGLSYISYIYNANLVQEYYPDRTAFI